MLTKLHLSQNNNIICAKDFNLLFNIKLDSYGGNPVFKKHSVEKVFEQIETQFDGYLENKKSQRKAIYFLAKTCIRVPLKTFILFYHFQ